MIETKNRLKELRKAIKKTQKEFAKENDIPLRTLQNWENGESQIKPKNAEKLAKVFEVSVGYLLGFNSELTEVTDDFLSFHNETVSRIQQETQVLFLDFLARSEIILTNAQIEILLKQMEECSELNRSYLSFLYNSDSKEKHLDVSFYQEYIPTIDTTTFRNIYTPETMTKQIKLVDSIINGENF
ncbi:helix-turn-helix domain-containing protein [Streptococcus saliviloxodontae]|uniref:Transcriptional regulator with XRE-family HTH domain n=1 Tax=Streptococcus saliviloxodontae TaxID=1349416 RepID=A0ABS2PJI8_9STRE|nr:helix-turn-helix transcriptional regulator [Streptococcus saliviloxodontae]MBM7635585.1 transcriptional regulator with XRE-family HTH domain [Streptococcus saliviloxodontae]